MAYLQLLGKVLPGWNPARNSSCCIRQNKATNNSCLLFKNWDEWIAFLWWMDFVTECCTPGAWNESCFEFWFLNFEFKTPTAFYKPTDWEICCGGYHFYPNPSNLVRIDTLVEPCGPRLRSIGIAVEQAGSEYFVPALAGSNFVPPKARSIVTSKYFFYFHHFQRFQKQKVLIVLFDFK